jgi:hypothetical protein
LNLEYNAQPPGWLPGQKVLSADLRTGTGRKPIVTAAAAKPFAYGSRSDHVAFD